MNAVVLKSGKDKAVKHRHPWVFSGAIQEVLGSPENGETIQVLDHKREFLGTGAYSQHSQIRVRLWSFKKEAIDQDFFARRIMSALQRRAVFQEQSGDTAWRLVHGESDGLPGMVVDQYNDVLVLQILSSGVERHREEIVAALQEVTGIKNIYERSDVSVRKLEGMEERTGTLAGSVADELTISENGLKFIVNVKSGHKTGFYLDQRENRRVAAQYCRDKDVLNVFSYSGGFSVFAAANGARTVTSIDSSAEAMETARRNMVLNGLVQENCAWLEADAFKTMRHMRDQGQKFDVLILDPPKFAATFAQVEKAARGYKDINWLGFQLLQPGGTLITFSCSGGVSEALFQKIVADAALDAGVTAAIVQRLSQGPDHPVGLNFPEGAYLKGLVLRSSQFVNQ